MFIKIGKASPFQFKGKSLPSKIALTFIDALSKAFMQSKRIDASSVLRKDDDTTKYIKACQLIHDNTTDTSESQRIRNACLFTLEA